MLNVQDILISIKYREILRILANASSPMTILDISKKINPSINISKSELVDLIDSLHKRSDNTDIKLFRWDQIPGDHEIEFKVFEIFLKYLKELNYNLNNDFVFKKNATNNKLTLFVEGKAILELEREHDDPLSSNQSYIYPNHPDLIIVETGKKIHLLEDDEGFVRLPTDRLLKGYQYIINSLQYYKRSSTFLNSELQEESKEYRKRDPSNKRYYLSISGLLLYILNEVAQDNANENVYKNSLTKSISNLSKNFIEEFPFLYNYDLFQDVFYRINSNVNHYGIDLLIKISKTLKSLLDSNPHFLNYWVTKKYHDEVSLYILVSIKESLLNDESAIAKLIHQYSLRILPLLETYLENEFKKIRDHIKYINDENITNEELFRGLLGEGFVD